jgi:hypothetical protein
MLIPIRRSGQSRCIAMLSSAALVVWAAGAFGAPRLDAQAPARVSVLTPELQNVRAALDKYRDPAAAIRDGYFSTVYCIEYIPRAGDSASREHAAPHAHDAGEQVPHVPGGMGVHFFNTALVGPELDPLKPQVLLYEQKGDALELVAAEWFVPLATGIKQRPTLFGRPFDGPMEGHAPVMPETLHHYDLHVWLWKPNPAGVFQSTNPDLKCPDKGYSMREAAPMLVKD